MTSHLLLEGYLDVKDPRGSEDRKFWKAWRRAWTIFSVIYPPGRRVEPYLLLTLSHSASDAPEKEVKISRDGLRLFRCRSKSRQYRTWAMASGNKVVLYFAAENEVQGQNWMQSVRDGLWPPCFSFQMLTDACSQEVSLIDDDNTFLSGLLGVYGRFVLTSEDTISLIHPHWGSTLLEVSLNSIKDVLLVREAEVPPAGVFSIVLKRVKGSKVKTRQFFCNAAKEVIDWIISKLYGTNLKENNEATENNISTSNKNFLLKYEEMNYENKNGLNVIQPSPIQKIAPTENNTANVVHDLQKLKLNSPLNANSPSDIMNNVLSSVEYGKVNKRNSSGDTPEQILLWQTIENECSSATTNKLSNLKSNDHVYANALYATYSMAEESASFSKTDFNNTQNEYQNIKMLNKKVVSKAMPTKKTPDPVYSVINKTSTENANHRISEMQFVTSQMSTNENVSENENMAETNMTNTLCVSEPSTNSSKTNCENPEITLLNTNEIADYSPDERFEHDITKAQNVDPISKDNRLIFYSNSQLPNKLNKSRKPSNEHIQNAQLSIKDSLNDYRNTKMDNSQLLLNRPSEFLDTSLNFARPGDKLARGSSSSEEDTDISKLIAGESDDLNLSENLYEDIIDRKYTVYEEIDASDDESVVHLPPELPKRPENLEIPNSLRLQKLSKSINQTLENTESTKKEFPRTKFIKKIKDTNRIMQISSSQEHAKESFAIEVKLPVSSKTMLALGTNSPKNIPQ